jgi:hypothetical protein
MPVRPAPSTWRIHHPELDKIEISTLRPPSAKQYLFRIARSFHHPFFVVLLKFRSESPMNWAFSLHSAANKSLAPKATLHNPSISLHNPSTSPHNPSNLQVLPTYARAASTRQPPGHPILI